MKKLVFGLLCFAVSAVVMPGRMNTVHAVPLMDGEKSYYEAPEEYTLDAEWGVLEENGFYRGYEDRTVTDENLNQITSLVLHVGETKTIKTCQINEDGSLTEHAYGDDWILEIGSSQDSLTSSYDNDYAKTWRPDIENNGVIKVQGLQETGDQILYLTALRDIMGDPDAEFRIPVTVLPAEEGAIYPEETGRTENAYANLDEMCAAMRQKELAHFNGKYTFWAPREDIDVYMPAWDDAYSQNREIYVYGFCSDQGEYAPYEGDYLMYAGSGADWETINFPGEFYKGKRYDSVEMDRTEYTYMTTCEQEQWMNDRIAELCGEGGELGAYRNASDYDKVKACMEYIQNHVSYIGTTNMQYHSAYSALHDGQATCEGYALLYYRLLREFGIQNRILVGMDEGAHGYNIVLLNGSYYYCDVLADQLLRGEENFQHAELQPQFLTEEFQNAILSRISQTDYNPDAIYSDSLVEKDGKYYFYENGVMAVSKEAYVDGAWRWFDADGSMAVDKDVYQTSSGGKWVRYNEKGEMIKGEDNRYGGWYYFEPITGTMMKGPVTLPDGRKVFYDTVNGQMLRGEHTIDGLTFVFDEDDGHLVSGPETCFWIHSDDKDFWYEGWQRQGWDPANEAYRGKEVYDPASDAWYWLDNVQHGAKAVSKDVYQESLSGNWGDYIGEDGQFYGKWVRYDANGHMIKGWQTTDAGTYFFDYIYGTMAKGEVELDGNIYHFDEVTGVLK